MRLAMSHYGVELPSANMLKPIICYCRVYDTDANEVQFVEGMDISRPMKQTQIDALIQSGQVIPLPKEYKKTTDNGLFLDPYGNIFLASKREPLDESTRFIVARLPKPLLDAADTPTDPRALEAKLVGMPLESKVSTLFEPLISSRHIDQYYLEVMQKILLKEFLSIVQDNDALRSSISLLNNVEQP